MTVLLKLQKERQKRKEALPDRKTTLYNENFVIGEEKYLKPLFEKAIELKSVKKQNDRI